jgi:hypothetical protein
MIRPAPPSDDAALVAQCDVAIRELARGRIICGIADAGIGGDGDCSTDAPLSFQISTL